MASVVAVEGLEQPNGLAWPKPTIDVNSKSLKRLTTSNSNSTAHSRIGPHEDDDSDCRSKQSCNQGVADDLSVGARLGSGPAWASLVKTVGVPTTSPQTGSVVNRPIISTSPSNQRNRAAVNSTSIKPSPPQGYPSPPTTPEPSLKDLIKFPTTDDSDIKVPGSPSPPTSPADHQPHSLSRRVASTASLSAFKPPRSPFTPRTPSIASVSTLPPDFGRYAQVASGWATEPTLALQNQHHSQSSPVLHSFPHSAKDKPAGSDRPSASPAWRRAIANKLGRLKPIWGGGSEAKAQESRASALLSEVLKKDDASAGEGMYWATQQEHDDLIQELDQADDPEPDQAPSSSTSQTGAGSHAPFSAVASSSGSRPSTPSITTHQRPVITQRRSFVDPTDTPASAAAAAADSNKYLRPPQGTSSRRRHVSSPLSGASGKPVPIDPLLLELERRSRVGVKTRCACCGKQGYNFPATKEGKTFCSRECRRGGGGVAHLTLR